MSDNSLKKGRYTRYSNKIGLYSTSQDQIGFLNNNNDVVLSFPFKDTILEAGMSKEDAGREERFLHQEVDSSDIDTLFEPKVLTNIKYSGIQEFRNSGKAIEFFDENGNLQQNLLIKGNNLLALYSLREKLAGKVKLIYIDPPYNTESDSFTYNDSFNHSSWLTFMKNRLEVARDLLKEEGVIFVQCDDNEQAYLKVLMDEIFGRSNFLNQISVKMKQTSGASGGGEDKKLKKNIEYIIIYTKNMDGDSGFKKFNEVYDEEDLFTVIKQMRDEGKSWKYTRVIKSLGTRKLLKTIHDGSGQPIDLYTHENVVIEPISKISKEENISEEECYLKYFDFIFRDTNAQSSIRTRVMDAINSEYDFVSIDYTPISGKSKGKKTTLYYKGNNCDLIAWLKDVAVKKNGQLIKLEKLGTYWDGFPLNNLTKEGDVLFPNGKKPEQLLKKIIELATDEGDIVLDYHLGSGTTCAVAHKMNRRWIGIEQMNYIEDITLKRLTKVIDGEQSGISKAVNWQGGGSFVYFELKKYNQDFLDKIIAANSKGELDDVYTEMAKNAFLKFWFDKNEFEKDENFRSLDLDQRKELLISILDENQLYLNHADMRDSRYHVTDEEMALTDLFYGANND
ncbi:site-specific DNA-methyltransferase [Acinetobacter gerneri]|uniref:site-specific DNA-methyltransferase n=1 Tax=Acinetobacter gerneri TaxID=202952 RepID=UPI0028B0CBA0|nr:site-specific DNA-methyltransferase [Acinetobacter gerneri]